MEVTSGLHGLVPLQRVAEEAEVKWWGSRDEELGIPGSKAVQGPGDPFLSQSSGTDNHVGVLVHRRPPFCPFFCRSQAWACVNLIPSTSLKFLSLKLSMERDIFPRFSLTLLFLKETAWKCSVTRSYRSKSASQKFLTTQNLRV